MPSLDQLLLELRARIAEIEPSELQALLNHESPPLVLDVRENEELYSGRIPEALHLPRSTLELQIERMVPERSRPIVTYCAAGMRSLLAADSLHRMGYSAVLSLSGGMTRWREEGRPLTRFQGNPTSSTDDVTLDSRSIQRETGAKTFPLSAEQRQRYQRHLAIPQVGEAGQHKLLEARVLIVGAGGLGSPAAYYLAAAGVGRIGIVDFDVIELSNLQRQILHNSSSVGQPKVTSARQTLLALNPDIIIDTYNERLSHENVESIISSYDIVIDGSDNFRTRYLINDMCAKLGVPNVHGSVFRFQGQVSVFAPPRGPCYRCVYPEPPDHAPSCTEAGVLGVLPGVIGLLQANETLKLILGIGEPLISRLLRYDALAATAHSLLLRRDPVCPCCSLIH